MVDKNISDYFEAVLGDKVEQKIIELILKGNEGNAIIEEILNMFSNENDSRSLKGGHNT